MVKYEILAQFIPVQDHNWVRLNTFGFSVSDFHGWHEIVVKNHFPISLPNPITIDVNKNLKTGFLDFGPI